MPTPKEVHKLVEELSKKLADEGKIIEGGWTAYRITAMHPAAPALQVKECRIAFFAGAHHLFSSIMSVLDAGTEPTEKDLQRMSLIQSELDAFIVQFKQENGIPDESTKFQG